jgi:predicted lipid-binding transport protein (Tim44 family)
MSMVRPCGRSVGVIYPNGPAASSAVRVEASDWVRVGGSASGRQDGKERAATEAAEVMGQGLDIILLAMFAVFLVVRLYKVLGRRTGNEQQRDPFPTLANDEGRRDKVIPLPDRARPARAEEPGREATAAVDAGGNPVQAGLARIRAADPDFDQTEFLVGARTAFEMIVNAYAAGDAGTLRPLLNDEVFENFSSAIKARQQAKETLQTTLVGITSAEILEADLSGRNALITVKIVSEQINVTRNADGQVADGDPSTVATVTDIWTFSRNTRSRDPNWTLVATRSPN